MPGGHRILGSGCESSRSFFVTEPVSRNHAKPIHNRTASQMAAKRPPIFQARGSGLPGMVWRCQEIGSLYTLNIN